MVTNNEYAESEKLYDDHKGFIPGQAITRRITDFSNVVPVHNYERKIYNEKNGKDFE